MRLIFVLRLVLVVASLQYSLTFSTDLLLNSTLRNETNSSPTEFDTETEAADDYEECRANLSSDSDNNGQMNLDFDLISLRPDQVSKSVIAEKGKKWSGSQIPFKIEDTMNDEERYKLFCAMKYFDAFTCIRFIWDHNDTYVDYIYITKSHPRRGCFTEHIGNKGGEQIVNLDEKDGYCWEHGTIIHELMHVLGFFHEQARNDRDKYIDVHWSNIPTESVIRDQFKKAETLGVKQELIGDYDCGSVMHYAQFLFGLNKPAMSAKKSYPPEEQKEMNDAMGNRERPTDMDTKKLNLFYCPDSKDCVVGGWLTVDQCSVSCGGGNLTLIRNIIRQKIAEGKRCPALQKMEQCNTHPCPIDCEVSEWKTNGPCSATCGHSVREISREITRNESNGGKMCPDLQDKAICNVRPQCTPDCILEVVAEGQCSVTCGTGRIVTYRKVVQEATEGGEPCPDETSLVAPCSRPKCNTKKILISGGWEWDGFSANPDRYGSLPDSIELLDPVNKVSEVHNLRLNIPRMYHSSAMMSNKRVMILGGEGYNDDILASVEIINLATNYIYEAQPMLYSRMRAGAAYLHGCVYVCGGENTIMNMNYCEVYKNNKWYKIVSMLETRVGHSMVALDSKLYAIGGWNDSWIILNSVEMYYHGRWSYVAAMKYRRAQAAAAVLQGYIHVCGGCYPTEYTSLSSCERYDASKDVWDLITELTAARHGFSMVAFEDNLYAIGGQQAKSRLTEYTVQSVDAYDPSHHVWEEVEGLHSNRESLSAIEIDYYIEDKAFLAEEHDNNERGCIDEERSCAFYGSKKCMSVSSYMGDQSATQIMTSCKNWSKSYDDDDFLGAHNECRNPNGALAPWCFTGDQKERQFCFSDCNEGIIIIGGYAWDGLSQNPRGGGIVTWIEIYNSPVNSTHVYSMQLIKSRICHKSIMLSYGQLMIIGGRSRDGALKDTEILHLSNDSLSMGPPMNIARFRPGAAKFRNAIHICGGKSSNLGKALESCESLVNNEWTRIPNMQEAHPAPAMVAMDPYLYVIGAVNVERYDGHHWQYVRPMNYSRSYLDAAVLNNRIYVCGGGRTNIHNDYTVHSVCECYDPVENAWQDVASMNVAREDFSLVAFKGYLYALGGRGNGLNDRISLDSVEKYDPSENIWVMDGNMARARECLSAAANEYFEQSASNGTADNSCVDEQIPCANYGSPECKSGEGYMGKRSLTESLSTCQNWTSEALNEHNYCRNPDGKQAPWCYTVDNGTEWEYCFPDCNKGILVIGGAKWHDDHSSNLTILTSLELFHPMSRFSHIHKLTFQRSVYLYTSIKLSKAEILIAGGYILWRWLHSGYKYSSSTHIINIEENNVIDGEPLVNARASAVGTMVGNTIYICGGYADLSKTLKSCEWRRIGGRWQGMRDMLEYRAEAGMVSINRYAYVLGGRNNINDTFGLDTVERFDGHRWQYMAPMKAKRALFGVAVHNNKIYVCGGTTFKILSACECYNPKLNSWLGVASMNNPRSSFALVSYKERIYAFGGCSPTNGTKCIELSSIEAYDLSENKWIQAGNLIEKRFFVTAAVIG